MTTFYMYDGAGALHMLTTAAECHALIEKQEAVGAFPGETSKAHSMSHDSVFLHVANECMSMTPPTLHRIRDGILFADQRGIVHGYVYEEQAPGCVTQYHGLAFIGG
jgi:hypothetical protein